MIYTDYKIASERHFEVCLQLQDILEKYQQKETLSTLSFREQKDKVKILAGLYYLSGYIIECSYNCAIYKYLGWTADITQLNISNNPQRVSCYQPRNGSAAFVIRRQEPGIRQHQFSGNMHFFQTVCPVTIASTIPLIGYDVPHRLCYDLFDNWNAEIRYLIDSSLILNYANVFDFFFLSVEVYEGLLKNAFI